MKRKSIGNSLSVRSFDASMHHHEAPEGDAVARSGPADLATDLPAWSNANPDGSGKYTRLCHQLIRAQVDTVLTLVAAVEAKDHNTEQHSVQVSRCAEHFARELNLSARETEVVRVAGLLHDVGKIAVPDAILRKPGALTTEEFALIKEHPANGAAILRSATCLRRELPLVLHHHEWFNGRGYPSGLKGDDIPFGARILHVADAIDAMLYPRSYKKSCGLDWVTSEIQRCRGTQFDPVVADVALCWLADHPERMFRNNGEPRGPVVQGPLH